MNAGDVAAHYALSDEEVGVREWAVEVAGRFPADDHQWEERTDLRIS